MTELVIYCDESDASGARFSNFYGGLLVRSRDLAEVRAAVAAKKAELNLHGEIKWQKVTKNYLPKYIAMADTIFDLAADDRIKLRIMFTQNLFRPTGLTTEQREQSFFLLYYQFIKHAFGLPWADLGGEATRLRINFDQLPDTREKCELFKDHIAGLNRNPQFRRAGIQVARDQIAEIDSKRHDLLQCVDIVLGAMQFRLNNKHKVKPAGQWKRGSRTIAKEKLYKHINQRIQALTPWQFNIGVSTGSPNGPEDRWRHAYRHWLFKPAGAVRNDD
ncbi:MAG: hypothetical protein CMH65_16230 [Nevskiales bacterium]|nr:hypothetical protein [Nevskiales bacterium]